LIGRDFGEVVRAVWPEPFASEVLAHFRRTLTSGEPYGAPTLSETRKDTPEVESYDWQIERIVLPDGGFGVVCYFYDLTEREQAAEALRRRTAQFETLFNDAPLGIYLVDAELRICLVNPQALPEFGDIQGLIGSELAAVMQTVWGPARADDIVQQFRHTLATGEPFEAEELIAERVDRATTACYEWQIHRIPLPDGSHGVVCHFREISTRVQAQAQILDSELRFRALVSASSDVVYRMNADWTEMRHLQGREFIADTHEPNGSWLEKYIQPCDQQRVIDTIREAVRTKGPFELEHQVLRIDGTPGWTFSRAIPLMDKDGTVVEWFGMASDVTARKRAQEALSESEQKYRALFESMDEGYCVIEMIFDADKRPADYRFLEVNPAFEKHTGLRNAQGKRVQELAPDQEAYWFETYGRVAVTGEAIRFVNEAKALEGRWLDVYAFRLGSDGSHRVAVLFNDISDRKASEDALRASENRSRTILESITDGFYALDADWRITYFNAAAERYLDRSSGDLIGKRLWDEFPGAVGSEFEQMYRRVVCGQGSESITAHYPDFDRWYEVTASPASGGLSVYFRDVTESRRTQELLRASEQRQRMALDAAELGMWHVDPATRATKTDARFRAIFGTTEEWTDYLQLFAVMHPDDLPMVQEAVAAATRLDDPVPYAIEYRIVHPDGSLRWVFAKGRSSIVGTGPTSGVTSFDGTVADITDRKRGEVDLIAALAAAESANQAKSDFLSRMSHELRSPLNAVLGFAQLLQSGTPPPTVLQEKRVDQILKAGWYLLGLINEILDLSQIESGRLTCVLEPVPLAEVLDDCQALVEGQAQARGIGLNLPQKDDLYIVTVDRTRIKQVFVNLLSNAIKYNRKGGTVQVHVEAAGRGRVCIRVEDTGSGLSPEQLGLIFEPFERLGQEAGSIEGTGIGLALSKRLVELMGGRIGVRSVVGQGSVFWVELDTPGAQVSAHPE
jgi:PAS domain S-box-containing protein